MKKEEIKDLYVEFLKQRKVQELEKIPAEEVLQKVEKTPEEA